MEVLQWEKILALPLAIIVLVLILFFVLRVLPTWKEIRLAEIKVRENEAISRTEEASIFGQLSDTLKSMSSVMERIVIEQQRETKNTHILQRVNADASDKILSKLDALDAMSEKLETGSERLAVVETDLLEIKEKLKLQE